MYKKYLKYKSKYEKIRDNINIKNANDQCDNDSCLICFDSFEDNQNSENGSSIQLECGCCIHEICLIGYIKNSLEDRTLISKDGIKCPFKPDEHIRVSAKKILNFLRPDGLKLEPLDQDRNLTDEELVRLNEFQDTSNRY